jgi:hypothetical protein
MAQMAQRVAIGVTDSDAGRCLNCGAEMHGAFCAACGQRSVPADPTVAELAGDAWQELSGYDGRVAETFKKLLHPGRLTLEYLAGHRARYLSPVRLYLTLSVIYFLVAAAAPVDPSSRPGQLQGPGSFRFGVWTTDEAQMTAEDRAEMQAQLNEMWWPLRALIDSIQKDPAAFRNRLFVIMPRVFFGMLPVFAGIVWLFYRGRKFPAALVFATHLHACAFLAFTVSEAAKFTMSQVFAAGVSITLMLIFVGYVLRSFKAVFGESWPRTLCKAAGIGVAYSVAAVPAFMIILIWASLT